jgi:hypothetical protein
MVKLAVQKEMLWSCSNDYDTEVKFRIERPDPASKVVGGPKQTFKLLKDKPGEAPTSVGEMTPSANQGVCSGLSAEWCKNILKGVRPELSKPFLMQGMIYQRFYDWGDDAEAKLMEKAGLGQMSTSLYATARLAAQGLWRTEGAVLVGLSNHMTAMAKTKGTNGTLLYFDPNFGCYAVSSELRLQQLIEQAQSAVGATKEVEIYLVKPA